MGEKMRRLLLALPLLLALLTACVPPTVVIPPISNTPTATSTEIGGITPTSTQSPSSTPFFDNTPTPTIPSPSSTPTVTPTLTPTVRTSTPTPLPEGPVVLQTTGHGITTTAILYPDTLVADTVLNVREGAGLGFAIIDQFKAGERFGGWIVGASPSLTVWVNLITRRGKIGASNIAYAHKLDCGLTVGVLAQNDVARIVDIYGYATDSFISNDGETEFFVTSPVTITLLSPVNGAEISGSLYLPLECNHAYASVVYGP